MNLRHPLFLVLPLLILITSCDSSERKKEAEQKQKGGGVRPPARADAYIVKTQLLTDKLETPGSLLSNQETEIHPEVAGRITGIYFKEGSFVNKGALLVKLNDADLQAQRKKIETQIRVAQQNLNRSEKLLKIGGISKQDYENTELTLSSAKADLAVTNTQIEKTNIRAPFSGKLGLRLVSSGAYVSTQTALTTISQLNQMKIDFTVPERYIPQIKLGQFVNFTVEGNNRTYAAKIVATQSKIMENTRSLQVRAAVQGSQSGLTPGNFAKVIINFEPNPNAIMIPTQAIVPQARGKRVYLYNRGKAKAVDVTTGLRDSANVQVLTGLKPGDTILVTGLLTVRPDAKVNLGRVLNGTQQPKQKGDSTKVTIAKQTK
ncbi:MAG: efflux RND transporter periplasmic adaptor subunit [Chitinophagaceae bacterium]